MRILVIGEPRYYQQEALDMLALEGVEVVRQEDLSRGGINADLILFDECLPEKTTTPLNLEIVIPYKKAATFVAIPKQERTYPTLREKLRGRR